MTNKLEILLLLVPFLTRVRNISIYIRNLSFCVLSFLFLPKQFHGLVHVTVSCISNKTSNVSNSS